MKNLIYVLLVVSSLLVTGCQEKDWCTVVTKSESETELYDAKVIGWPGVLTIGGNFGGVIPVPDEITITWKSIKQGKEEEAKVHLEQIEQKLDKYLKEKWDEKKETSFPEYESFPPELFESHKVVLVLKGKVPKRPKNGEIFITYTGNENFDVKYVENPINSNP